jgi:SAM-dependent methyltransferase
MFDVAILEPELRECAAKFQVSPEVHTEDYIFQFIYNHPRHATKFAAMTEYFASGHTSATRFDDLVTKFCVEQRRPLEVLEFAAGYGCVTRHLKKLDKYDVYSCDIHPQAVDFLSDRIGVRAILSNRIPSELPVDRQFDVVFALSFFSHMPDAVWEPWLRRLLDFVADDGLLIFTTHGHKSVKYMRSPPPDEHGYWFRAASEQKDLPADDYGTTVTTARYVVDKLHRLRDADLIYFEEGLWWGHQDACILRKMPRDGAGPQAAA